MKRIISALLAVFLFSHTCIPAFASNLDEIYEAVTESENRPEESVPNENGDPSSTGVYAGGLPTILKPTDQLYDLFIKILKMYANDHLYEFTEEEALYKFIYDMIATHPEFYELMVKTLLGTMDPYSTYHEKNSGFLSLESSSAGYGITVADTENGILIEKVLSQSEAEKAGLMPGDILTGINGFDVKALPWYAVSVILKRPYVFFGQKIDKSKYDDYNPIIYLTVDRNGIPVTVSLKKGLMITDELTTDYKEMDGQKVAYIGVSSFVSEDLSVRFLEEIKKFKADGYTKLVIDLRDNGGGSLKLAIEMAEVFVDNGETLCYYNNKNLEEPLAVISDTEKIDFDSISILVNENTASAAELMASILRNKAGAVLVGKKTFGKAIGQSVYNLVSGAYITITTYEVLDANKESYNEIGLKPELELDNVEMLYQLPSLEVFNHVNYKEIIDGVYSEPCLALEKRLVVLGMLREEYADGIWDNYTSFSVYILQTTYFPEKGTGSLDDKTVSLITELINNCKDDTYLEDSQLECALLYHSAFDQARRLIKEKERLGEKQQKLIKENNERLEAEAEAEN